MNKLLTIVIPSYNVETTLRKTVESMLVSNDEFRKLLDILIVNDGSQDGTSALAHSLAESNPGVVRVWDKENGGHGSTINVGIDHGYGKYMKVVDGDDWLDTSAFEEFIRILKDADADVVVTDYCHYYQNSDKMEVVKASKLPYGYLLFKDIWDKHTFIMSTVAVKTELLRCQSHRIDEHCYYVDVEFDALSALVAETILYVDLKLYVYRMQQAGQSVSVEGWIKHYRDHQKVVFSLIEFYRTEAFKNRLSFEKQQYLKKMILLYGSMHYKIGWLFPNDKIKPYIAHIKDFDNELKKFGNEIYLLLDKDVKVKILRMFGFPNGLYYIFAAAKKITNQMPG